MEEIVHDCPTKFWRPSSGSKMRNNGSLTSHSSVQETYFGHQFSLKLVCILGVVALWGDCRDTYSHRSGVIQQQICFKPLYFKWFCYKYNQKCQSICFFIVKFNIDSIKTFPNVGFLFYKFQRRNFFLDEILFTPRLYKIEKAIF